MQPGDARPPRRRSRARRAAPARRRDASRSAPATRASSDGTARPVTVAEMIRSTSCGVSPAALSASVDRAGAELDPASMKASLDSVKSAQLAVPLERQRQVPRVDAGVLVEPAHDRSSTVAAQHLG